MELIKRIINITNKKSKFEITIDMQNLHDNKMTDNELINAMQEISTCKVETFQELKNVVPFGIGFKIEYLTVRETAGQEWSYKTLQVEFYYKKDFMIKLAEIKSKEQKIIDLKKEIYNISEYIYLP